MDKKVLKLEKYFSRFGTFSKIYPGVYGRNHVFFDLHKFFFAIFWKVVLLVQDLDKKNMVKKKQNVQIKHDFFFTSFSYRDPEPKARVENFFSCQILSIF